MSLSIKGPKVVKAADIVADIGLEIVNPEQIICTVTTDRTLDIGVYSMITGVRICCIRRNR